MRQRLFAMILVLAIPPLWVGIATPVSAQTTTTIDLTSATLIANGAAVDLDVTVTCEAESRGSVGATVTQRSGNAVMEGTGSTPFVCTGMSQIVTVPVLAEAGGRPFKVGEAVAHAFLSACGFECQFANTTETIRISR